MDEELSKNNNNLEDKIDLLMRKFDRISVRLAEVEGKQSPRKKKRQCPSGYE